MEIRETSRFNKFDDVEIMCPYCFETFHHDEVGFRTKAITQATKDEWNRKLAQCMQKDDTEGAESYKKKLKMADQYGEKKDTVMLEYWKSMGWEENSELYEVGDGYSEHHDPQDDDAIAIAKVLDPIVGINDENLINTKRVDEDGFVVSAIDNRGEETERRVCPHCHNKLPKLYGKNPIKFLAIVGVSGVGKTVMLSKLLEKMGALVDRVGLSATKVEKYTAHRYITKYKIEQNMAMPEGTNKTQFKPPIFVNLVGNDQRDKNKNITLVIYDIAGENCVNPDKINVIGPFVKNANGIIMLLDPEQIDDWDLSDRSERPNVTSLEPETVINTMANAFLCDNDQKSDVPLAVAFSKSDLFRMVKVDGRNIVGDNSNIFRNIRYSKDAFMIDEFQNIDGEVRQLLQNYSRPFYRAIPKFFNKFGFFAISTLGHDTENETDSTGKKLNFLRMNIEHTRLEEPLLWLLYKWKIIDGYSERDVKTSFLGKLFGRNN